MVDRGSSESDLRALLEDATVVEPDHVQGRWLVSSRRIRERWAVVVEPDDPRRVVVIVTAYRLN